MNTMFTFFILEIWMQIWMQKLSLSCFDAIEGDTPTQIFLPQQPRTCADGFATAVSQLPHRGTTRAPPQGAQ